MLLRVWVYLALLLLCQLAVAGEEPLHAMPGQPPAPLFKLHDLDDQLHELDKYRGKVVIVNFWASWCPPCRFELPSMERAYQALKLHDVVMLGINVGENADTIFTFTSDYPVSFPLLLDIDSALTQKYPVIGLPTSFIIDPHGRMVYRAIGTREWDNKALLERILSLKDR